MTYLHEHAGYTRVHNPLTSNKDLQRLPGLVAIAYQHETSRCGDPHLHTHVIVPNRQVRADGRLVSIEGTDGLLELWLSLGWVVARMCRLWGDR